MSKRNLLLCFDAFGTLFQPKRPIAQQYGEVARHCGLGGFSDDELQASFRAAFKSQAKAHPNYGKASGMGAEKWWTNIINNTFQPLAGPGQTLPADLAPRLLHRFSSEEGYSAAPGLNSLLKALRKQTSRKAFGRVIVGIISNSDDRVPGILSSFGLSVSPLRYGSQIDPATRAGIEAGDFDIDFHCLSYDVGFEKPDQRIFTAANDLAKEIISVQDGWSPEDGDLSDWKRLYVGDDYSKDVVGARNAGWHPVLLSTNSQEDVGPTLQLETHADQSIDTLFSEFPALQVESIEILIAWLCGRR